MARQTGPRRLERSSIATRTRRLVPSAVGPSGPPPCLHSAPPALPFGPWSSFRAGPPDGLDGHERPAAPNSGDGGTQAPPDAECAEPAFSPAHRRLGLLRRCALECHRVGPDHTAL